MPDLRGYIKGAALRKFDECSVVLQRYSAMGTMDRGAAKAVSGHKIWEREIVTRSATESVM